MPRRKSRRQRSQTTPNTLGGKTGAIFYARFQQSESETIFYLKLARPVFTPSLPAETRVTANTESNIDYETWSLKTAGGTTFTISQGYLTATGTVVVRTTSARTGTTYFAIPQLDPKLSARLNAPFAGCLIQIPAH